MAFTVRRIWCATQSEELAELAHTTSFAEIEAARGEISLSYFEFGTLSALWLFQQARLDVVILEVGLGGRLDATNIVDADVAAVIQSTRQGVGKQIADMVRQLINGDDIDTLQVLWQPEFSPGQTA